MYLSFYGLKAKPFQISADPHFLWLSEKHKEALATLKYGILDNKGVILLTGDIGLGKTTLIHTLLNSLGDNVITAIIPDPGLNKLDFVNFIANAFKMGEKFRSKGDFLIQFDRFLNDAYLKRKKALLIIDEAQRLSNEMLEEVRLLSNFEKQHVKLLNIFIVGQEEVNTLLSKKENRALKQRVTINYKLDPLTENETYEYIKYRLKIAGTDKQIFTNEAVKAVFLFSKGCPRLINIICDHSMLTGYVKDLKTLTPDLIYECEKELALPDLNKSLSIDKSYSRLYDENSISFQKQAAQRNKKINQQNDEKPHKNASKKKPVNFSSKKFLRINLYKPDTNFKPPKKKKKRFFLKYGPFFLVLIVSGYFLYSADKSTFIKRAKNIKRVKNYVIQNIKRAKNHIIQKKSSEFYKTEEHFKTTFKSNENKVENLDKLAELISEKQEAEEFFLDLPYKMIVPFEFNSNQIDQKAYKRIDRLAEHILEHSDLQVVIKGYTDSSGDYSYNQRLSAFRANIVKSYLVGKGVDPLIIKTMGIGPEDPIDSNTSAKGRKNNRRVEIEISKIIK